MYVHLIDLFHESVQFMRASLTGNLTQNRSLEDVFSDSPPTCSSVLSFFLLLSVIMDLFGSLILSSIHLNCYQRCAPYNL